MNEPLEILTREEREIDTLVWLMDSPVEALAYSDTWLTLRKAIVMRLAEIGRGEE